MVQPDALGEDRYHVATHWRALLLLCQWLRTQRACPAAHVKQAPALLCKPVLPLDTLAPPFAEVRACTQCGQLVGMLVDPPAKAVVVITADMRHPAIAGAGADVMRDA